MTIAALQLANGTRMSGPAKVRSADSIEEFRVALIRYEIRTQNALEVLTAEVRRAIEWLEYDCPKYWKKQIKESENAVHQARLSLERCLMFPVADERPTCREQREEIRKSKERLEYCREKRETIKYWKRRMSHERFDYEGRLLQLRRLIEIEIPNARGKLQAILRRIDEYQVERPPEMRNTRDPAESNQIDQIED